MYPVITVPDEAGDILEQLGTKPKFWFSDANANRYLFKLNRSEGEDATGEDWSEKVVTRRLHPFDQAQDRHQLRYQVPDGTSCGE